MNKLAILCIIVLTTVLLAIAPSCAKAIFEPSNLTLSPQEVKVGQSATILVDITNTGGAEGSYPVILKIDGVQIDDQTVTVAPGTTQQASFTIAKEEAGSYTIDVNGLTATLKVLKPAEFKTEALIVSPTEVFRGSSSTVTVDVTNVGEVEGDYEVKLRVNDKDVQSKQVTLAPGATETVSFYLSEDEAGTHNLSVNGLSETIMVKLKPAEFKTRKLIVSPEEMPPGSSCKVTVEVTNIGDIQGDCEVTLRVNDEDVETKKVTLAGGATETVSFYLSKDEAGTFNLSVNGLSETLTVREGALPTLHIGDQWVYRLILGGTSHTMTQTITGEEKIDGSGRYVVKTTFDPPAEGLIPGWTDWWEKRTLDRIQWQFSITSNGVTVSSTKIYSYSGIATGEEVVEGLLNFINRWPREVGNEWTQSVTIKTVDVVQGKTTTSEMKVTEQYEVEAMETVTTPAGKFECFKIVVYAVSISGSSIQRGQVKEEMWYSDKVKARVKYESVIGESWELLSYSLEAEWREMVEEEAAELSFEARTYTYTTADYGFSIQYPSDWEEITPDSGVMFQATGPPYDIPGVGIAVIDIEEGVSFADAFIALLEEIGHTGIEVISESETTLADGTPASILTFKYTTPDGYLIDELVLGVEKDGKRICVGVYTVKEYAPFSEKQMSEIAHTLTFQ